MFFKIKFCSNWFIRIKESKISNLLSKWFPSCLNRLERVFFRIQKMFQEFLFFFESFDKNLKRLQINIHQTTQIFKLSNRIFLLGKKFHILFLFIFLFFQTAVNGFKKLSLKF